MDDVWIIVAVSELLLLHANGKWKLEAGCS